jgi:hypothetical protein
MPPGAVIASTLHYSAQQTSYVTAGNVCGAENLPGAVTATITSWPYLVGVDVMAPLTFGTIVTVDEAAGRQLRRTFAVDIRWKRVVYPMS